MSAQLSLSARRANTSVRWCGVSTLGRPKRTPRTFARLRPSPGALAEALFRLQVDVSMISHHIPGG
jgi:hypothetical protein